MQCITQSGISEHQLRVSGQLPGLAPFLGGERSHYTKQNEANEVFIVGEEWEALLTASSMGC